MTILNTITKMIIIIFTVIIINFLIFTDKGINTTPEFLPRAFAVEINSDSNEINQQKKIKIGLIGLSGGAFDVLKSFEKELNAEMIYLNEKDFKNNVSLDLSGYDVIYTLFLSADLKNEYEKIFSDAVNKNPGIKIFACRNGSNMDIFWPELFKKGNIIIDKTLIKYYGVSKESLKYMVQYTLITYFKRPGKVEPPEAQKMTKIYHTEYGKFDDIDKFLACAEKNGWDMAKSPRIVIGTFNHHFLFHQPKVVDALITEFKKQGILAVCLIADAPEFKDLTLKFKPDVVVQTSSTQEDVKFWETLGAPRIHAVWFTEESIDDWLKSDNNGMNESSRQWQFSSNEFKGAAEFITSGGTKSGGGSNSEEITPIEDRIKRIVGRAASWARLARKQNSEKKVSFIFYDIEMDKSGLMRGTGHLLNAPRSIIKLLNEMKEKGYKIDNIPTGEVELIERLVDHGRQMGVWEKGTLDKLARSGKAILLPEDEYIEWFKKKLPQWRQDEVTKYWGAAPGNFLVWTNQGKKYIVIPRIDLGNIILLPQPLKGEAHTASAAIEIAHDRKIPPPHNYLATYFWLEEKFKTDAVIHFGTHGTEWLFPGKPDVLSGADWSDILLSNMPNINPWMANNSGEVVPCRRRAMAVITNVLPPPLMNADLSDDLLNLESAVIKWQGLEKGALKDSFAASITEQVKAVKLDNDLKINLKKDAKLTDDEIGKVYMYLHDIKNQVIPANLHVLGEEPPKEILIAYIVTCLGKRFLNSAKEIFEIPAKTDSDEYLRKKSEAFMELILNKNIPALEAVKSAGGIVKDNKLPEALSEGINIAVELFKGLKNSHQEIDSILSALNGKFITPGPAGNPERNPAVVPSGRNMYVVNPEEIPSKPSWEIGTKIIKDYLADEYKKKGKYPRKIAFSLIPLATYGDYGVVESQILYLMGVRPVWDSKNSVTDVKLIPAGELGRPRIDVFLSARNVYCDQLPTRMRLLDKAVRLVAALNEKDNYVYEDSVKISAELEKKGVSKSQIQTLSQARIFGWAPGEIADSWFYYLTDRSGEWDKNEDFLNIYLSHCRYVYTEGMWGINAPEAYNSAIQETELVLRSWHDSRSTPLNEKYGWWVDGTLSQAVKHLTGKEPGFMFIDVRDMDNAGLIDANQSVQTDFRARVLNPKWIKEMMKDGYAGADIISKNFDNIMGWKIMRNQSVTDENLEEVFNVYVRDSRKLNVRKWLDTENPYAFQKMTGVLLETIRKDYWKPAPEVIQEIAAAYAESISKYGVISGVREGGNEKLKTFTEKILAGPNTPKLNDLIKKYQNKIAEANVSEANKQVRGPKLEKKDLKDIKDSKQTESGAAAPIAPAYHYDLLVIAGISIFIMLIGYIKGPHILK